jgi:two-component system cell cycle response regulator
MEAKLGGEYYDVRSAADGHAALAAMAAEPPDLVVLDIMMPGMDGFEVCRRIKADAAIQHIPVVMVTALNAPEERVRGLSAGADDFLTRPVDDIALFARIRSLLRWKQIHDELRSRLATSRQFGLLDDEVAADAAPRSSIVVATDFALESDDIDRVLGPANDVSVEDDPARAAAAVADGRCELAIVSLASATFDGLRLCSTVRSNPASRQVPIIAIVEDGDRTRLARALDLGVSDYVVAPVDTNELIVRVRNQLRRFRAHKRLCSDYERSLSAAASDALTGLYGRRYLLAHLSRHLDQSAAEGRPLAVVMLDIDHFKAINDEHGHLCGDRVLQQVARRIEGVLRVTDLSARYGGEEFIAVLPSTDEATARIVAERLRAAVDGQPIVIDEPAVAVPVSVSVGVASRRAGDDAETIIDRADQALYSAKRDGRNRVVAAMA